MGKNYQQKLSNFSHGFNRIILSLNSTFHSYKVHLSCCVFVGAVTLLIGIRYTVLTFKNLLPTSVLDLEKTRCQYIYITDKNGICSTEEEEDIARDDWVSCLGQWWTERKRLFVCRLLEIARSDPSYSDRARAVDRLSRMTLNDHDYYNVASFIDAATAASLARSKNVDSRFFKNPNSRAKITSMKELKSSLRTLLSEVCQEQNHLCLKYFVSKAFPDQLGPIPKSLSDAEIGNISQNFGQKLLKLSEDTFLQLCLEALLHHSLIDDNIVAVAKRGGVQLLYEVLKNCEGNSEVENLLAKLILRVSLYEEFAEDILVTGWMEVLHGWLRHADQRLCTAAGCALTNLDIISSKGHSPHLGREVMQLYPLERDRGRGIDVVLIHGLLGGVHYTWKQRDPTQTSIPLFAGITSGDNLNIGERGHEVKGVSNKPKSNDHVGDDFEFVFSDIPLSCNQSFNSPLSVPGTSPVAQLIEEGGENDFSLCWPLDWLAQDCPNIRLLGLNYETKITDWLCWCPFKESRMNNTIDGQADYLLDQLLAADIGSKPTVWIVHSMGGLLLKHMILKASKKHESEAHCKFVENTKAIIYLSTPHLGSPLACLNEASRFLLLPSALVDQLRLNAPALVKLHTEFLEFLRDNPISVTTFNETKNMKITSLEIEIQCVPAHYADSGVGEIYEIPLGHMDICKPDSRLSFIYQKVLDITKKVLKKAMS